MGSELLRSFPPGFFTFEKRLLLSKALDCELPNQDLQNRVNNINPGAAVVVIPSELHFRISYSPFSVKLLLLLLL